MSLGLCVVAVFFFLAGSDQLQVAIFHYGAADENVASMDLSDGQRQSVSSSVPRSQQVGHKKIMDKSDQIVDDK